MSKTSLFWSVIVATVCAAAAAQEAGQLSTRISLRIPPSPSPSVSLGDPAQKHHADVVAPEPDMLSAPKLMIALPSQTGDVAPLPEEPGASLAADPGYEPQNECSRCGRGNCNRCRPFVGDRMRAWWADKKARLQWSHWGYPEEFEERPFGTSVRAHVRTQITNGAVAQMVLYQYDFYDSTFNDPTQLNPHGRRRLHEIVALLHCNLGRAVIEPADEDPKLDSARRDHVVKLLQDWGEEAPEEWVVVADPKLPGLGGEEAVEIYDNLLRQTRMRGSSAAAGRTQQQTTTTTTGAVGGAGAGY